MRVFKYRGGNQEVFERDLNSLAADEFWAPTREKLNDPCEGFMVSERVQSQIDLVAGLFAPFSTEVRAQKNGGI